MESRIIGPNGEPRRMPGRMMEQPPRIEMGPMNDIQLLGLMASVVSGLTTDMKPGDAMDHAEELLALAIERYDRHNMLHGPNPLAPEGMVEKGCFMCEVRAAKILLGNEARQLAQKIQAEVDRLNKQKEIENAVAKDILESKPKAEDVQKEGLPGA